MVFIFIFFNLSRFQNCIFCILHCILYILAGMMTRRQLELINLIIYTVFKKNYLHSRSRFPHSHPLSQTYSFPKIQKGLKHSAESRLHALTNQVPGFASIKLSGLSLILKRIYHENRFIGEHNKPRPTFF